MIRIHLPETIQKMHWISETTSETNSVGKKFVRKKFLSEKKIYWKKNSWTDFCLRLNLVSDYITQLYFIYNHLRYFSEGQVMGIQDFPYGGVDPFWSGVDLWRQRFLMKVFVKCMHWKIWYVDPPM